MRKIARDALTNSQSAQGNTQKYQLYQFANKRSVPCYIFIKPVSDRQVLFNHLLNYQTIKNPKLYLNILEGIKRSSSSVLYPIRLFTRYSRLANIKKDPQQQLV